MTTENPCAALFAHIEDWLRRVEGGQYANHLLATRRVEDVFLDSLSSALSRLGYRVVTRLNLWNHVGASPLREGPDTVLKTYGHPLQPDVDLLVQSDGAIPMLSVHEVKVIRWNEKRPQTVAPATRMYAGLGQALALTTFGADYCCLWHVLFYPRATYRTIAERYPDRAGLLDDGRAEFTAAYSGIVKGILENYHLPLGYIALGLFGDAVTRDFLAVPLAKPWVSPTKLPESRTGAKVRELLMETLHEERRNKSGRRLCCHPREAIGQ